MSGVLVLAETRRGDVREITQELITAGRQIKDAAGGLRVAVVAADPARFVDAVNLEGVDEVLAVTTPTEHFEPHVAERALEALIDAEAPAVVLVGHTIDSLGFGGAVAARRNLGFATDVTGLSWDDGPVATRGAYGDKLVAELEFPGKATTLLMVRAGSFEAAEGAGSAATRAVEVDFSGVTTTEHVDFREAEAGDVDITKAPFLLSVGRGIEDKDNLPQFEELAERMGATLGVSRPLVDAGWVTNARQVGQSGKTVKPRVYLAMGISGAVQHLAGMQKADTIIAVNSDPEAPIFTVAHYGAVADLFDIAEELEKNFE
jgi:electron transfer flavoprotein alpha subunit